MSLMTNPVARRLRSALRPLGLNRLAALALNGRAYEARLNAVMDEAIQPGNCVWDIGANVGFYTCRFADLAKGGHVVAIEPSPSNFERLSEATRGLHQVTALKLAISDTPGQIAFTQGEDELGATSRVGQSGGGETDLVECKTGDQLLDEGHRAPNVIKIDVEGHELQVLSGMSRVLANPDLRHIIIEVHFALLEQAGQPNAPSQIEGLLARAGFETRWVDPSHLHGRRPRA